jgi:TonB family protein
MRSESTLSACATVRIFATLPGAATPIPRRGAVKVWTSAAEMMAAAALSAVAEGACGMVELTLHIDPAGQLVRADISTSSGDPATDARCVVALMTAPALPAPPVQLHQATVLMLAEFMALERLSA